MVSCVLFCVSFFLMKLLISVWKIPPKSSPLKVRSQSVTKDLDQNIWFPRPNLAKLSESLELQWKVDWWNIVGYFLVIPMCKTSFTKQFRCGNAQKCWIFWKSFRISLFLEQGNRCFWYFQAYADGQHLPALPTSQFRKPYIQFSLFFEGYPKNMNSNLVKGDMVREEEIGPIHR